MKKAYRIFKKVMDILGTIIDTIERILKIVSFWRWFKKED